MGLYDLASLILILNHGPISRIRFSRTIYFVHKELTRKKLMRIDDIAYLRLPLGPVPEGYMTLASDHPDIVIRPIAGSGLSYEAEEFTLPDEPKSVDGSPNAEHAEQQQIQRIIQRTLLALQTHPTSELVSASHDQSWTYHKNGERYFLTPADLKNTFPFLNITLRFRLKRPTNNEIGLLQATLLRGMLNDIVRESTDLEYPDEIKSTTDNNQVTPKSPGNHAKANQRDKSSEEPPRSRETE